MPNFTFTRDIPDANSNPSVDQSKMKTNYNSTDSVINVDHFGFNDNQGGWHKVIHQPSRSGDPALIANVGQLYTKVQDGIVQLFYESSSGIVTQLTPRTATVSLSNGSTWLPGNILLQWGEASFASSSSQQTFTFPVAFPTSCYNIQTTPLYSVGLPGGAASVAIRRSSVSASGFQFLYQTNASNYTTFYWSAIGN